MSCINCRNLCHVFIDQRQKSWLHFRLSLGHNRLRGVASDITSNLSNRQIRWFELVKGRELFLQGKDLLLVLSLEVQSTPLILHLAPNQISNLLVVRGLLFLGLSDDYLNVRREHLDRLIRCPLSIRLFESLQLIPNLFCFRFPLDQSIVVGLFLSFGGNRLLSTDINRLKERPQTVIILLKNRIELVIVTLGTLHPESQKDIPCCVGQFVDHNVPLSCSIAAVVFIDSMRQKTGRDLRLRIPRKQFISRKLFLHKLVIGFVFIKRLDHIIPVTPGIGTIVINPVSVRIRIPHQIQPMPRPAFPILGAREQLIDNLFIRIVRRITDKRCDLFRRWRQSNQVKINATNERRTICFTGWRQPMGLHLGDDKVINRVT